jgi:transcriptional regulator with XRE-family HTH domain
MYNPIDVYVGKKIRFKRKMLGLTQSHVSEALGLSFQQVQKYESGENRVSASMLYEISQVLNTNVNYFFEGYDATAEYVPCDNNVSDKDAFDLLSSFSNIDNERLRKKIRSMVAEMQDTH